MPNFARNPLSFPRSNRLKSKYDFQSVFAASCKISQKHLLVLYRPNQKPDPRVGIVVAKHHLKRAVDRNVIKRLVRESFRHHKESLKGLDIIVLLRSKCTPLDKTALREEIDNLWRQLKKSYKPVL